MIDEIREFLHKIDNKEVETSDILDKIITFFKLNDLKLPELFINESNGYINVNFVNLPDLRKVPLSSVRVEFSSPYSKARNVPITELFQEGSEKVINILEANDFPINHPIKDING